MTLPFPKLLALDFDGVLCNGEREYFQSSQKAYGQVWPDILLTPHEQAFYRLRPVIETGWEMPLLLRALVRGYDEEKLATHWGQVRQTLLLQENLHPQALAQTLDQVRDHWIQQDLPQWLGLHGFYPHTLDTMNRAIAQGVLVYIITTKEGRFVQELLERQGCPLPSGQIIGKEAKMPKYEILRRLKSLHHLTNEEIIFVEDRLAALLLTHQQRDLRTLGLWLAAWGYNLAKERETAQNHPHIQLLSLEEFTQGFPAITPDTESP